MRCWRLIFVVILLVMVLCSLSYGAGDPYLGIWHEVSDDPPGLRIQVVTGAPADLAGLKSDDVITAINGVPFTPSDADYATQLTTALSGLNVGDTVTFSVVRTSPEVAITRDGEPVDSDFPLQDFPDLVDQSQVGEHLVLDADREEQHLEIDVTLGARPGTAGEPFPPNDGLACDLPDAHPEVRELLETLSAGKRPGAGGSDALDLAGEPDNIKAENADLFDRLNRRATPDDGYKLSRVVYLLRDGLKGEALTRQISDGFAQDCKAGLAGFAPLQAQVADLLDIPELYAQAPMLQTGLSAAEHLDVLQLILNTAAVYVRGAFADFTPEELDFIASQRGELTEVFRALNYIDSDDDDPRRIQGNVKLIKLAKRVDYEQLLLAELALAQIADEDYLRGLRADLLAEFSDRLDEDELLVRDTDLGPLVISGTGETWRSAGPVALLIDLGGDDFYTTRAGSGFSLEHPVSVLLELGGDDAYESTELYSQGSGSLGCGLLIDLSGNDQYVGLQWAQGTGFFGCGALLDLAGNDVYRGEELCQAAGIFGSGVLVDYAGDDRFEGQMKCQAFGGAHAVGLLVDVAGDDERYCKGKYPTGYGDAGIFDSWGQACAQGFRGLASGGIAGIIDCAGSDYSEAGNFSQGGGYYFGYGFFHDRGWEDDRYLGSRYNQGFCAHQAVGVFLEDGGDDWYSTRQAVAQGLAWDECTTMFVDYGGDDYYDGGTGFSQGASAHNALCVMWDRGGRDSYIYPPGQARAGGNDYHGGTSLSLFIDEGGDLDYYTSGKSANNALSGWPEYGFFADLPGQLKDFLAADNWREFWIDPPK